MNTAQIVAELKESIRLMDAIDASRGRWFAQDCDYDKHEYGSLEFYRLKINRCKKVLHYLEVLCVCAEISIHSTKSNIAAIKEVLDHRKKHSVKK